VRIMHRVSMQFKGGLVGVRIMLASRSSPTPKGALRVEAMVRSANFFFEKERLETTLWPRGPKIAVGSILLCQQ